jgi:hypothetical protein
MIPKKKNFFLDEVEDLVFGHGVGGVNKQSENRTSDSSPMIPGSMSMTLGHGLRDSFCVTIPWRPCFKSVPMNINTSFFYSWNQTFLNIAREMHSDLSIQCEHVPQPSAADKMKFLSQNEIFVSGNLLSRIFFITLAAGSVHSLEAMHPFLPYKSSSHIFYLCKTISHAFLSIGLRSSSDTGCGLALHSFRRHPKFQIRIKRGAMILTKFTRYNSTVH